LVLSRLWEEPISLVFGRRSMTCIPIFMPIISGVRPFRLEQILPALHSQDCCAA
jgi:hypothetical protein